MGLFKSKYRTSVATNINRVVEDSLVPNTIKTSPIVAMLAGGDTTEYILEGLVTGIALKAGAMYRYADKYYTYGLPSGELYTVDQGIELVEQVLQSLEGVPVEIEYSRFGPPNNMHIAWMKLANLHGYNSVTNEVVLQSKPVGASLPKGQKHYLHDMVIELPALGVDTLTKAALTQWGLPPNSGKSPSRLAWTLQSQYLIKPSPTKIVNGPINERAIFYTAYTEEPAWSGDEELKKVVISAGITVDLSGYNDKSDYIHVKYAVNGVTKYVMYEIGTGVYPQLDSIMTNSPKLMGEFYPFTYFRYSKKSEAANVASAGYKTSKKMLKFLGMDYDQIVESINDNPDVADVEQAMMIMAVPAKTENVIENKYLFDFFSALHSSDSSRFSRNARATLSGANSVGAGSSVFNTQNDDFSSAIVIQDRRFKMALSHDGILRKTVGGFIGKVGTCSSSYETKTVAVEFETNGNDGDIVKTTRDVKSTIHIYRKQVSTFGYTEIQVVNLSMTYNIFGNYNDVGEGEEAILLVPLDYTIVNKYSLFEKEELISRSLHYVFNTRVVTKIKWYQTGLFKALLIIAAIVIFIYTGYADFAVWIGKVVAGTITLQAAFLAVLKYIVISMAIQAGLKVFVKAVGGELAMIIAIVAMVVSVVRGFNAGSLKGAPWAKEILQLSNGLTKAVGDFYQDSMLSLQKEFEEFQSLLSTKQKALNETQKELDSNNWLTPFVIFGEKPSDYFQRTIHSGNIGALSLDAPRSFVSNALALPTFNQTLEGFN